MGAGWFHDVVSRITSGSVSHSVRSLRDVRPSLSDSVSAATRDRIRARERASASPQQRRTTSERTFCGPGVPLRGVEEANPHAYIHLDSTLGLLVPRDRELDVAVVCCVSRVRKADHAEVGPSCAPPVGHKPSRASGVGDKADDAIRYSTDQRKLKGVIVGRLQLGNFAPYAAQLRFKSFKPIIVARHQASVASRSVRMADQQRDTIGRRFE